MKPWVAAFAACAMALSLGGHVILSVGCNKGPKSGEIHWQRTTEVFEVVKDHDMFSKKIGFRRINDGIYNAVHGSGEVVALIK